MVVGKAANSFMKNLNILILFSYYQTKDFNFYLHYTQKKAELKSGNGTVVMGKTK